MTTTKLPQEFKTKWLKALRSGDYQQGSGSLYKHGKYCCLGVACIISGGSPDDSEFIYEKVKGYAEAPEILRGSISPIVADLSKMNDQGIDFKTIADYIEIKL